MLKINNQRNTVRTGTSMYRCLSVSTGTHTCGQPDSVGANQVKRIFDRTFRLKIKPPSLQERVWYKSHPAYIMFMVPPYLGETGSFRSHYASVHGLPGVKAMLFHGCQRRHSLTCIVIGPHSNLQACAKVYRMKAISAPHRSFPSTPSSLEHKGSYG